MSNPILVHFHGLTATPKNFTEQKAYNFSVKDQIALPYMKYVHKNTAGVALIEEITEQISSLLCDGYPTDTFVFHGNSAGGVLALSCATDPDISQKTAGLVLNCSAGLRENFGVDVNKSIFTLLKNVIDPEMVKHVINTLVQFPHEEIPDWLVEEIQGIVNDDDGRQKRLEKIFHRGQVFKKDGKTLNTFFSDRLECIKDDKLPVLIVGGTYDTVTPPEVIQEMASKLDVEPVFLATGHVPHIQQHEKFNSVLNDFLAQIRD